MEFENIISRESYICDKFVAKSCTMISGFTVLVWVLNLLKVFVVKPQAMAFCTAATVVLLSVPLVTYLIRKTGKLRQLNYKYFSLAFVLTAICVLYSFLTFHVIFVFLFPSIIFNIYGDRKLTKWTVAGTLFVMVVSHIASVFFGVNPEEPFRSMYTVLVYGLLPKIIIYMAFIYAFIFETDHNNGMLRKVYSYAHDMHDTQEELIRAFAEMCESKSGQTGSHVKRVSQYVSVMACKLSITGMERESLVTASMMHDVGKLNIAAEILDKPGKLTADEYEIIKKHTKYGYDLLKNSPGRTMEIATDIALNHHERWDGNGYNGLKGEEISLYSRIMAVADVFDALVSRRSYKEKWSPKEAYNEIICQSGKQFDPSIIEIFTICYPEFLSVIKQYPDD